MINVATGLSLHILFDYVKENISLRNCFLTDRNFSSFRINTRQPANKEFALSHEKVKLDEHASNTKVTVLVCPCESPQSESLYRRRSVKL